MNASGCTIRFGPAGLGSPQVAGIRKCHQMGLRAAEVAFTYGVRMSNATATELGKCARDYDVSLSIHAPYYINLASMDAEKLAASRTRILDSCERAYHMAAEKVIFHAGFYQKRSNNEVFEVIRDEIGLLTQEISKNGWNVTLCPETTGKKSQFSGLEDLLEIRKQVKCGICVDFAHLYARNLGVVDYDAVLAQLEDVEHIHSHFSGINFTAKGEKSHEKLTYAFFQPLGDALARLPGSKTVTLISEAPDDTFDSAAAMLKWFQNSGSAKN